ncbi:hypothetical protein JCM5296_001729 [Sporobolomyces johnsonii]
MPSSEEPPKKKRKLPSLDDSFSEPPRRSDSPLLHQGRTRATPHVQGQWAAHVYLELELTPVFRKTLKHAVFLASSSSSATIHSLLEPPPTPSPTPSRSTSPSTPLLAATSPSPAPSPQPESAQETLHISLSRPLFLQTNQRADLLALVAHVAAETRGFAARYAAFGMLENDERTRRFLAIEVGEGYDQLKALVKRLDASLARLRLPAYYDPPRFHTSIAWTPSSSSSSSSLSPSSSSSSSASASSSSSSSPGIPFNAKDLERLEAALGRRLRAEEMWVGHVAVKVGKDVSRYRFAGMGTGVGTS